MECRACRRFTGVDLKNAAFKGCWCIGLIFELFDQMTEMKQTYFVQKLQLVIRYQQNWDIAKFLYTTIRCPNH